MPQIATEVAFYSLFVSSLVPDTFQEELAAWWRQEWRKKMGGGGLTVREGTGFRGERK